VARFSWLSLRLGNTGDGLELTGPEHRDGLLALEVTPTIRHGSAAKKNSHRFSSWQDLASSVSCMLSMSHRPIATSETA
jgi:hypothetical protein